LTIFFTKKIVPQNSAKSNEYFGNKICEREESSSYQPVANKILAFDQ